jgi:hypothetical protein
MSRAFTKEEDAQWLNDIQPTMTALIRYLTNENNGVRVYEKKSHIDPDTGKEVHEMSNGFSYSVDANGKWFALE